MYHPLVGDLSKFKEPDLEAKITELSNKYQLVAKMGQRDTCSQILAVLDMYRLELGRRQAASMQNTLNKQHKGLDELINVK